LKMLPLTARYDGSGYGKSLPRRTRACAAGRSQQWRGLGLMC
jgi:hypothetical protein